MKKSTVYIPKVSMHSFTHSDSMSAALGILEKDVSFEQVQFERHSGTILEAIEYFSNNKVPEILLIEEHEQNNTLYLLEQLAVVLDGETELILVGKKDSIHTYKTLKSLGIFEYLLNDVSAEDLLVPIQAAALKIRSGKAGKVVTFIPMSSASTFDDVFHNFVAMLVSYGASKNVILDLNFHSGNTDLVFQLEENSALSELLDRRNIEKVDVEQICRTVLTNLDVISNSNDFSIYADDHLARIYQIVGYLRELYDNVFVLMPLGWQKLHAHLILRSDRVVLIGEDYLSSFRDAVRLSLFLNGSGFDKDTCTLVLKSRGDNFHSRTIISEIQQTLPNWKPIVFNNIPTIADKIEKGSPLKIPKKFDRALIANFEKLAKQLGVHYQAKQGKTALQKIGNIFWRR